MRNELFVRTVSFILLSCAVGQASGGIIFSDNFTAGASPLWGNERGAWAAAGGVYDAALPLGLPNVAHSSLPFNLTDFALDIDINDLENGGVWLRSTAAPGTGYGRTGVLLVTGGASSTFSGLYWHIATDGNDTGPGINAVSSLFTPGVSDPHLRIEVVGNNYSVFVNGSSVAATTLTTGVFASGRIALYDVSNQTFDNVIVDVSNVAVPEPSTLALFGLGTVCFVSCRWWKRRRLQEGEPAANVDTALC